MMNKKLKQHRLGMVGLGSIFEHQYEALALLPDVFIVAGLCDTDSDRLASAYAKMCSTDNGKPNVNVYGNIEDLLEFGDVDTVMIATPPATHYELVHQCLVCGKNVILEKPAVLQLAQLEELLQLAREKGVTLYCAFHAAFAPEVLWYGLNAENIKKAYELENVNVVRMEHRFYDNYVVDGVLMEGKETLGGSYIDSSVNELSVAASLVDLQNYVVRSVNKETLPDTETVCRSKLVLADEASEMTIECHTDWTLGVNKKQTQVFYDDGTIVTLDHSSRSVQVASWTVITQFTYEGELPRLVSHYYNLFKDAAFHLDNGTSNGSLSLMIHKLLLD